jgi:hypothetical protein
MNPSLGKLISDMHGPVNISLIQDCILCQQQAFQTQTITLIKKYKHCRLLKIGYAMKK